MLLGQPPLTLSFPLRVTSAEHWRWNSANVGQTSGLPVQGDSVSLNSSTGLQRKPKPADRRPA